MMFYRIRQRNLTTILVFSYISCLKTNAFSLQSSNLFEGVQKTLESIVNRTQFSLETTTLKPSPAPQSIQPINSNDDDWYFAYQRRPHNKPAHNKDYANAGANNNKSNANDCFDRYGRGGLGQLACRDKVEKSKINIMKMKKMEMSRMMMNAMSKNKAPKDTSQKCDIHKKKSCLDSTVPSIVPSSVPQWPSETPKSQSTGAPNNDESVLPTSTNVPSTSSSPTFSAMPSNIILPTEYPTFESTKQETPSLPPISYMPINSPIKKGSQQPTFKISNHPTVNKSARPSSAPTQRLDLDLFQRATPFGLTYGLASSNNVTSNSSSTVKTIELEHIKDASDITVKFLEDYLDEQLFGKAETIVDYYISNVETVENNTGFLPVSIVYSFGIVFNNSTTFILTQQEVDVLIESGFRSPFVDVLIATLQQLDSSNPFFYTMSIVYMKQSNVNTTKSGRANGDLNMTMTEPPIKIDDENSTSPPVRVDQGIQSFDTMISQYEQATVKVTPFSLTYKWIGRNDSKNGDLDPTIGELKAASNITLFFVDQYLHTMLDLSQPGAFTYFVGYSAGMIYEHNVIEFRSALQFQDTSMFSSIQSEVDMIMQTAFIPHYVQPLIQELRTQLPGTNPFSKTIAITFEFHPPVEPKSEQGLPTLGVIALVMAILLFVILAILYVIYRYHKWNRIRRKRGVPKIIIHSNHDPIHGDLIEIISSDEPDENDEDAIPPDGLSSMFASMHQQLMSPLATIDDTDEIYEENSTIGSMQYKTTRQYTPKATYSDGWSSTSSSTSTLSVTLPLKYTEPKIFEDID
jgi:hypothetical protein